MGQDSPQLENGYLKIANDIYDAFCRARIPGVERQILDCIIRKTYGWGKKADMISIPQFQEMTGLKKQHVDRALNGLVAKNIIIVTKKDDRTAHVYELNKRSSSWKLSPKKVTSSKKMTAVTKKDDAITNNGDTLYNKDTIQKTLTKDKKIPFQEIVLYLNEKTGSKYKHTTAATQKYIRARWGEGFRVDDFKAVVDVKTTQWAGTDQAKYLRPATLFNSEKFEGYLSEASRNDQGCMRQSNGYSAQQQKELDEWLKQPS